MRFKLKQKKSAILGQTKIKIKFLWFPVCINREIRWLEFAKIQYEYTFIDSYTYDPCVGAIDNSYNKWIAVKFLPYDPVKDCEVYKKEGCAHVDGFTCNIETCVILNTYNNEN